MTLGYHFLLLNAFMLSSLLCQSLAAQQPASRPPQLYGFCIDMPKVANPSITAQAKLLKELGFDGVGYPLWFGDELDKNLGILDQTGIKLHLAYMTVNLDPSKPAFDPRVPESFKKLKGRPVTISVLLRGLPPSDPRGMAPAVNILRQLADQAAQSNLRLSIYHHLHDWTESFLFAAEVAKHVERTNVGVNFNLCHWLKIDGTKDYRAVLASHASQVFAVTLNGAQTDAETWTNGLIQPLDRGNFDKLQADWFRRHLELPTQ